MFDATQPAFRRGSQGAIIGLAVLSVVALIVTVWILIDFYHEQQVLRELTAHLPASDLPEANQLASELRLQTRLSILLILNIIASAIALSMLVRAYVGSERSLRKVRVLATDVLASLDQGVITTDREGNILSVNPRGQQLLDSGRPLGDLKLSDLACHQPLERICRRVLDGGSNVRDHDYSIQQDGHVRHLRAGCSSLLDHDQYQLGTVLHIRDVTERKLIEQRLRRMERYMGLGSLAAGLQHEIRNPLAALSLHVQLLQEQLDDESASDEVRPTLKVIRDEVQRVGEVLERFRDYAAVDQLNLSPLDLNRLVDRQMTLVAPRAQQNHVRLSRQLDSTLPMVPGDRVRLEQVLLNLMLNALEAMPEGGTLRAETETIGDEVVIRVVDTGRGIPEDLRDRILDPYFTTKSQGTGLGLALSDKIMRQHGGSLDFDSAHGRTCFELKLPRVPADLTDQVDLRPPREEASAPDVQLHES